MLIPTVIMGLLACALVYAGYARGQGEHLAGLDAAWSTTVRILPLLLFAFVTAGMVQVLLPHEVVAKWIGGESGMRGILLGSVAGGLAPGGPYVSLPLAAGLFRAGAGTGTMVAFITGWSLWSVSRLPMEVGVLGWRFTLIRLACTCLFPPLAGFVAQLLFPGSARG